MTMGLYKIINTLNDKFYLGSSKNIEHRFYIHKSKLKNNKHDNIHLQNAWNLYGESNFEFKIIEIYDGYSREKLFELEQIYLDNMNNNYYNFSARATGGDLISYHKNREDIVKKIGLATKKRYELMTDEEREKLSSNMRGNKNHMFGEHHSDESKKIISKKLKEFYKTNNSYRLNKTFEELFDESTTLRLKEKLSQCASKKIGDKNPFYGKKHSKKTKDKLSKIRIGKYNGDQNIPIIIDGIFYYSLGDAHKVLKIPIVTIRWRVLSKNIKFKNYKYFNAFEIYINEYSI